MPNPLTDPDETFEISAVARLTGISTHTLRIWERRYELVTPDRSDSKRRRYTREDVRHLTLIKTLVDQGYAIGTIAKLTTEQLENRVREGAPASFDPTDIAAASVCRVAVVGDLVANAMRQADFSSNQLRIVSEASDVSELETQLRPGGADILIVERATLFSDAVTEIQALVERLKARRAIIVYRFAPGKALEEFAGDVKRIVVLRAPVNAAEMRLACLADILIAAKSAEREQKKTEAIEDAIPGDFDASGLPKRIFNDAHLTQLSSAASVVQCECPQHLASLLAGLNAFEEYSAECENRNADDAKLHAYLHKTTAEARATMEQALSNVLEAEGIALD